MNITDELREWAKGSTLSSWTAEHLTAIADRIDAEHESACAEAYGNGVMSVPIALDESQWVQLPKDADGEPWRLGDELMVEGEVCEVVGIGGKTIFYAFGDGVEWTIAHNNRHYHAPTVEDVLREMLDAWGELPSNATNEAIVSEFARRLRLREDA